MGGHAGDEAPAKAGGEPEQQAEEADLQYLHPALIAVRDAEEQRLRGDAEPRAAEQSAELPLEIAAEDELLDDAGAERQQDPERQIGEAPDQKRPHARDVAVAEQ